MAGVEHEQMGHELEYYPEPGELIEDDIIFYKQKTTGALSKAMEDDFNLTPYIINDIYPNWCKVQRQLFEFYEENDNGERKENEKVNVMFDRMVEAMNMTPETLFRGSINSQPEKREWMPQLLKELERFRAVPWLRWRGNNAFVKHLDLMATFRRKNWPLNAAAWKGGKLLDGCDFDKTFAEFLELGEEPAPTNRQEGKLLVHHSISLTLQAARDLLINLEPINIPVENLLNEETRPTPVDTPFDHPLFERGTESRPGALAMKAYLSGTVELSKSRYPLDGKSSYAGEKRDFGVFADMKPVESQEDEDAKRQAIGSGKKGKNAKAPTKKKLHSKAGLGPVSSPDNSFYDYTVKDADRDIENLRTMANGEDLSGEDEGVTPVWLLPSDVLQKYRPTLRAELDKAGWEELAEPGQAARPENIAKTLQELEWIIDESNADVRAALEGAMKLTYPRLKTLKCTVFALRYARSLHMRLLLAARPSDDLLQARADRLEDWILHEEVWNAAHRFSLSKTKATNKDRPRLKKEIQMREANIANWRAQITALEKALDTKQQADDDAAAAVKEAMKHGEKADSDNNSSQVSAKAAIAKSAVQDKKKKKGEKETKTTEAPTRLVLDPFRYMVRAGGRGFSPRTVKRSTQPEFTVFAEGGPPGYEKLPKGDTYQKLQYMIILTFWRVLKAQQNGL
ncbi:hypothetical protein PGQ11_009911 [Apiospora arundinis]|uniref:Uncharacterized protein n=1 Tax=Apiospora arundinis TaxID=335852 RepID=A0ABR2I8P4_9PEZI